MHYRMSFNLTSTIFKTLKMKLYLSSLFLLHILSLGLLDAQYLSNNHFFIEHFDSEDYPLGASVYDILQDNLGYLWFATQNGLFKYDGYTFEEIPLAAAADIDHWSRRQINTISVNREGHVWGYGKGGLFKYNPTLEKTYRPNYKKGGDMGRIFIDKIGRLWSNYYFGNFLMPETPGDRDSLAHHGFGQRYPLELYDKIESVTNRSLASILKVTSDTTISRDFVIEKGKRYLILCLGEFDGKFHDFGWISDHTGKTVWKMECERSGSGALNVGCRVQIEPVLLSPGTYTVQYRTDNSYNYNSWYDLPPDKPEYWGIQILDVDDANLRMIDSINQIVIERNRHIPATQTLVKTSFMQDEHGIIWIGAENGLFHVDSLLFSSNPPYISTSKIPKYYDGEEINYKVLAMSPARDRKFWIYGVHEEPDGTSKGFLDLFDPTKLGMENQYSHESLDTKEFYDVYSSMVFDSIQNTIWLTRNDKLYHWRAPFLVGPKEVVLGNDSGATISDLQLDHTGLLWVSTMNSGLFKIRTSNGMISYYPLANSGRSFGGTGSFHVTSFAEDRNGKVWISTREGALLFFDPANRIHEVLMDDHLHRTHRSGTHVFADDVGNIWSTCNGGARRWNVDDLVFEEYKLPPNSHFSIHYDWGYRIIYETEDGHLWGLIRISDQNGVNREFQQILIKFDIVSQQFILDQHISHFGADPCLIDEHGNLLYYNTNMTRSRAFTLYQSNIDSEVLTEGYSVLDCRPRAIMKSREGTIWVGTKLQGLLGLDSNRQVIKKVSTFDGLPSNEIVSILEDNNQNLWLHTVQGMVIYNPLQDLIIKPAVLSILEGHGHSDLFVNMGDNFRHGNGTFYVRNQERGGFYLFHPDDIDLDSIPPRPIIEEIRLGNQDESEAVVLPVGSMRMMNLHWSTLRNNALCFSYTGLHFADPDQNQFAYQLDGIDNDWILANRERTARYHDVPPGRYTFKVKAANADGIWSQPRTVQINIDPPWYWNLWSQIIYASLLICMATLIVYRKYLMYQRKLLQVNRVNDQLQEIDRIKDNIITFGSNDLKTQLLEIVETAELLTKESVEGNVRDSRKNLKKIASDGRFLTYLISDLTDFVLLRQRRLDLRLRPVDLYEAANAAIDLVKNCMKKTDLMFINNISPDLAKANADEQRLQQILNSLLSSAYQLSSSDQIVIQAYHANGQIEVEVQASGVGISSDLNTFAPDDVQDKTNLQATDSTQMRLTIATQLIDLHGGKFIEEAGDEGLIYRFTLPTVPRGNSRKHLKTSIVTE